jgi:hypothetical protein
LPSIGSDSYSPTGNRIVKINTPTSGFIDPTTAILRFRLVNDTNFPNYPPGVENVQNGDSLSNLQLLGPPSILFSRCRSLANGTVVSDLQQANRCSYLFHQLLRDRVRAVDDQIMTGAWSPTNFDAGNNLWIPPTQSKWFQMPADLLCPLFSQVLYLPAKDLGLQLELELTSDPNSVVVKQVFEGLDAFQNLGIEIAVNGVDIEDGMPATAVGYSYKWHIEEVSLLCDVITLTSSFNSRINSLLLSSSLPIPCVMMVSQIQSLPQPCPDTIQVQALRSFARLRAILVSFNGTPVGMSYANNGQWPNPYDNLVFPALPWNFSDVNAFVCPLAGNDEIKSERGPLEVFYQLGGAQWPTRPCKGQAEMYYRLKQAMDQNVRGNFNIMNFATYNNHEFVTGCNFMKAGGSGNFSGIETLHGETLIINWKALQQSFDDGWGSFVPPKSAANQPPTDNVAPVLKELHIIYLADCVVNVGAAGVEVSY